MIFRTIFCEKNEITCINVSSISIKKWKYYASRHTSTQFCNSLLRRGFCFFLNRERGKGGKPGKAENRERRKTGKGGKSAREREKRRKPLQDFCQNMAKVVDIRPHTAGVQAKLQLDRKPPIQRNGTSEAVSCSKMEGNKHAEVDNLNFYSELVHSR